MAAPLIPGSSYLLTGDVNIGRCEFRKDEVVLFSSGGFSPYDDCYIYHFISASGEKKTCTSPTELADSEIEPFKLVARAT